MHQNWETHSANLSVSLSISSLLVWTPLIVSLFQFQTFLLSLSVFSPAIQSDSDLMCLIFLFLLKVELNENEGAWGRLGAEEDPRILSALMWCWLEHLKVIHWFKYKITQNTMSMLLWILLVASTSSSNMCTFSLYFTLDGREQNPIFNFNLSLDEHCWQNWHLLTICTWFKKWCCSWPASKYG